MPRDGLAGAVFGAAAVLLAVGVTGGGALSAPEDVGDSEALRPVVLKQIPMRAEPAAYGPR
ncbi:hypothetical protein [Streptomyces sp. NPDC014746]|uniref:hypothetical protein n=1 Tax=Streptomyces sp. NPDC014746 TaxID=3364904 RepID=UPI00370207E8